MTDGSLDTDHSAPYAKLAVRFAEALVGGDFAAAHGMLSPRLASELPADALRGRYEEMTEYGDGPADFLQLMFTMEEWADHQPADVGWAYVAITGPEFSEAVAVIVEQAEGELGIRDIEWGRP